MMVWLRIFQRYNSGTFSAPGLHLSGSPSQCLIPRFWEKNLIGPVHLILLGQRGIICLEFSSLLTINVQRKETWGSCSPLYPQYLSQSLTCGWSSKDNCYMNGWPVYGRIAFIFQAMGISDSGPKRATRALDTGSILCRASRHKAQWLPSLVSVRSLEHHWVAGLDLVAIKHRSKCWV